jgi:hypothetical protein
MIRFIEATKQDRLSMRILNALAGLIRTTCKGIPYDDMIKNGLNYDTLMGVIDFGISEGAFMSSYALKDWLKNIRDFFDSPPPQNILLSIYKELQKYPQGSIKGHN